jgi:hypothetical protein
MKDLEALSKLSSGRIKKFQRSAKIFAGDKEELHKVILS